MERITAKELPGLFQAAADQMAAHAGELGEMDAELGDGDLGLTMEKGFGSLPEVARDLTGEPVGKAIMKAGMKLSSVIPSTMGFLMSSGLMTGGKAVGDAESIGSKEYADFLEGFAAGIVKRGKCKPGERTVLDAIHPAAARAASLLAENPGASLPEVAAAAEQAAKDGVEATREMEPVYGKAAVHKAAAVGKIDQGACAGWYLLQAFNSFIQGS